MSLVFVLLAFPLPASAWVDAAWRFRRPVDVNWDVARGEDLALVDCNTAGQHRPDGADVRVTTEDGRPVPSRVLMVGPGDRVRVLFSLVKPYKRYYLYFGNPSPPPAKAGADDVKVTLGLLLEMRPLPADAAKLDSAEQLAAAWEQGGPVFGRTMLDKASLGVNPFGEQQRTVSRMSGVLAVPADGDYTFAMGADERGALFVDGRPVLFAASAPGDTRINATVSLARGKRPFVVYHANLAGDGRVVVAWSDTKRPAYAVIGREALGFASRVLPGPLEEVRKPFTADFAVTHEGECFYAGGYSYRYRFVASVPKVAAAAANKATFEWDFGDGSTSNSPTIQHVYLADGVYPVRLTVRVGNNADTQVTRLAVSRDWETSDKPKEDTVTMHAGMVESIDLNKAPPAWAARHAWLQLRAGKVGKAMAGAARVATDGRHDAPDAALELLREFSREALLVASRGEASDVATVSATLLKLWQAVPPDSDLQPGAAAQLAELYLWQIGDSLSAAKLLAPYASTGDARLKRLYGQSLLLSQRADEARTVLQSLPSTGDPTKQAAVSGASARTVEFHLTEGDWQAGEEAWEAWQERYPAEFIQGYSAALKVRLMTLKKAPHGAARVAEEFARAVPRSSYSPGLLDAASKLLAGVDPGRSAALRALLKERYPEDPLTQER